MNRIFENHWCRLLAGNISVALLLIGIPVAILFTITKALTYATAGIVVLGIVHLALIGLQISHTGSWIPQKWRAAGYMILPVIDVSKTVTLFTNGLWVDGFWAFVMAVWAAFVTIAIIRNEWRKHRLPKPTFITVRRHHESGGFDEPMEELIY